MTRFFTRERFGRPQFLAGALLMMFLGQGAWLVHSELHEPQFPGDGGPGATEQVRIAAGWRQLHGGGIAGAPYADPPGSLPLEVATEQGFDTEHSPLLPLVTAAPLMVWPQRLLASESYPYWRWLPRLPFLACGVLLGASLWYVARRLCGNTGGFLALTLYCFSPSMIQASAVWHAEPEMLAAWGAFGAIFTAIAVAHTLYAPREVVLWNWRRIVLLGISLAIAVGSQFSMIVAVPMALAFLFYVAPIRRGAGIVIWAAACVLAVVMLFATYFFHPHAFLGGMWHASFWGVTWRGFAVAGVYRAVAGEMLRACPALALLLPVAVAVYCIWPRTRYFGNTAPGLVAVVFIGLGMGHPDAAGAGFLLASIPFVLIFVSGVLADLMETRYRMLVTASVSGLMAADILSTVHKLIQITRG
jgi:hypothetical protein